LKKECLFLDAGNEFSPQGNVRTGSAQRRTVSFIMDLRCKVLTEVKLSVLFFWVLTPCGLLDSYQRFGESALKMEAVSFSETLVPTYKSTLRHKPEVQRPYSHGLFLSLLYALVIKNSSNTRLSE
jgi:hypothetical protein